VVELNGLMARVTSQGGGAAGGVLAPNGATMIDAFDRLEQFFSGTLSLLYNTLISLAILVRNPIRGSLRPTARYRVSTARQIGPSTLIFIIFLVLGLIDAFTIPSQPYALSGFEQAIASQAVLAFFSKTLVVAFVGASLADLFSRLLFVGTTRSSPRIVRQAFFPRFQYAIACGLLCQVLIFAIAASIGVPRLLAIALCLVLPAIGFWPAYKVIAKLCSRYAVWALPVSLVVVMSAAWVAFIEADDALGMANIGLAVAESSCSEIRVTGPKCAMLIYNGSPDDFIVDLQHLSVTFHAGSTSLVLQGSDLAFPANPESYIIGEKGKGFTLSFDEASSASSKWSTWFAAHQHAYFTVEATIPYRLANTLSSRWFHMDEWIINIDQPYGRH